jgi:hypothetical protein
MAATGATTQTVPAGSAATFNFSVANTGLALTSPIVLAVQGVPLGATASFNPSSLPPGGAATSFTLTIQTPLAKLDQPPRPSVPKLPSFPGPGVLAVLLLPAIGCTWRSSRKGRAMLRSVVVVVLAASGMLMATGCGDRINAVPEDVNAKTCTLTVTGTATSPTGTALQHSVNVTLEVL